MIVWRVVILIILTSLGLTYPGRVLAGGPISSNVTVSATIAAPAGQTGNLRLTGYAFPEALVTFLRAGAVTGTSTANSASYFDKTLTGLSPGVQTFSIYGTDGSGRTTLTVSVDTNIIAGSTITLSGFLLPPTISVTKAEYKRPETVLSEGKAKNDSTVTAFFNSETIEKQVQTSADGGWQARVTDIFHLGNHSSYALVSDSGGSQSNVSNTVLFKILLSADLNVDDKINLTDFSILMFNYGRANAPNKAADINDNGSTDLVDFSVMMFYWSR